MNSDFVIESVRLTAHDVTWRATYGDTSLSIQRAANVSPKITRTFGDISQITWVALADLLWRLSESC